MKLLSVLAVFLIFAAPALAQDAGAPSSILTFHGYPCVTEDCAGHRAGFDWAAEQQITDKTECRSDDAARTEGCLSYVDSLAAGWGDESESDEDYFEENYGAEEDGQ